jgi:hypothetical protein
VRAIENTTEKVLSAVQTIAAISLEDGMEFDSNGATAETIREEDSYSGIRVTLGGTLSRAVIRFHVDVNVGDPIWPGPQQISVPRLIEGVIVVRGYPLEMVLAEKIVTALERGTAHTRWRDFVDIYVLTGRFAIKAQALKASMQRVAQFRNAELAPLRTALNGYAAIAQTRWRAWLRKQRLDSAIPTDFSIVLERVTSFADPLIVGDAPEGDWSPVQGKWILVNPIAEGTVIWMPFVARIQKATPGNTCRGANEPMSTLDPSVVNGEHRIQRALQSTAAFLASRLLPP